MDDMLARIVEQVGSLTDQVVSLQAQVAQLKDEIRPAAEPEATVTVVDWQTHYDEGTPYYYNPVSGESLWTLPGAVAPTTMEAVWLDVEAGRRYTAATAVARYPQLNMHSFKDLDFEMARKPKIGKGRRDVRTYLAADVDALAAAERAKKRARPAPREPEPEPEEEEDEPDECPICLEPLDATATLDCGHRIHAHCGHRWARHTASSTRTRRGTAITCPVCRVSTPSSRVDSVFGVGDAIEAQWKGKWWPGVIDKLYKHKLEIHWENGSYNAIPRAQVRARAVETRADRRRRF